MKDETIRNEIICPKKHLIFRNNNTNNNQMTQSQRLVKSSQSQRY